MTTPLLSSSTNKEFKGVLAIFIPERCRSSGVTRYFRSTLRQISNFNLRFRHEDVLKVYKILINDGTSVEAYAKKKLTPKFRLYFYWSGQIYRQKILQDRDKIQNIFIPPHDLTHREFSGLFARYGTPSASPHLQSPPDSSSLDRYRMRERWGEWKEREER